MNDKLLILADLGTLKALRLTHHEQTGRPHLSLVEQVEPVEPHQRLSARVTDQAGRFPVANGGGTSGAMSHGENHNLPLESQRRTIKLLAGQIQEILERERVAGWYFAASQQIDQRILDELPERFRSMLQKHVRSDLTKIDKGELLKHFQIQG